MANARVRRTFEEWGVCEDNNGGPHLGSPCETCKRPQVWLRVYWLARGGDGTSDVLMDVTVEQRRILTDGQNLEAMAEAIETIERDPEYANEIRRTARYAGALPFADLYDVTDYGGGMLQDGVRALGYVVDDWEAEEVR